MAGVAFGMSFRQNSWDLNSDSLFNWMSQSVSKLHVTCLMRGNVPSSVGDTLVHVWAQLVTVHETWNIVFFDQLQVYIWSYISQYWSFIIKRRLCVWLYHLSVFNTRISSTVLRHIYIHRVPTIGQKKVSECEPQY